MGEPDFSNHSQVLPRLRLAVPTEGAQHRVRGGRCGRAKQGLIKVLCGFSPRRSPWPLGGLREILVETAIGLLNSG